MNYEQLNAEERSALAALRRLGVSQAEIGRQLGRHRSTVGRELKRNAAPYDGWYRAGRAQERAVARRKRSRRNSQFGRVQWKRVEELLRKQWSPEQVSGHLKRAKQLSISHEMIYRHVWADMNHLGQRDRVPPLRGDQGGDRTEVLLRDAASQLGARDQ